MNRFGSSPDKEANLQFVPIAKKEQRIMCETNNQVDIGVRPSATGPEPDNYWKWLKRGDDHMKYDEYQAALEAYDRSIALLKVEKPPWDSTSDAQDALLGKAKALSRLNRHAESVACFGEALKMQQKIDGGEMTMEHADVLMDKALALSNAGRRAEGAVCYEQALTFYRREWENNSNFAGSRVALTLFNLGQSFADSGDFAGALQKYNESLAIHRTLADKDDGELSASAAFVLNAKSRTLVSLERFEEALAAAQEAVRVLEQEVPKFGGDRLRLDLSIALMRQGKTLDRLHRPFEASQRYAASTELVREVRRSRGTYQEPADHEA